MLCPRCGFSVKAGATVCQSCGELLEGKKELHVKGFRLPDIDALSIVTKDTDTVFGIAAETTDSLPEIEAETMDSFPQITVETMDDIPEIEVKAELAASVPSMLGAASDIAPVSTDGMYYCKRCGNKLKGNAKFCTKCGEPVKGEATFEDAPELKLRPSSSNGEASREPDERKIDKTACGEVRRKRRKWPFVLAGILFILAAAIVGICIYMFPLNVDVRQNGGEITTTTGYIDDLSFRVKSNQPIRSVEYALNPSDPEDDSSYMAGSTSGSLFSKSAEVGTITVPPGSSTLYVRVKTWFGTETYSIELEYEIGYTSAPDSHALVEVQSGTWLISNELIVEFIETADSDAILQLIKDYDGKIVGELYFLNQYQIRFTGSGEDYINELKQEMEGEELVAAVYYNLSIETEADVYPNDSEYDVWDTDMPSGNNWGLECINAPGAWDYQEEMSVVKVGVIDSSLQYDHEDLQISPSRTSFLLSSDFTSLEGLETYFEENVDSHTCISKDCVFCSHKDHGTHCVGIIGALADNNQGISGVNWNTEMYFATWWYYSIPSDGQLSKSSSAASWMYQMSWLIMSGCRVVNVSIGSSEASVVDEYERSVADWYERLIYALEEAGYDFIICKAAGNSNDDASNYALNRIMTSGDSAAAHTIIVGAVQPLVVPKLEWNSDYIIYRMASYSNYGSMVNVCAPGTSIYSTVFGDSYAYMSGTSMATPMVAGVASLLYSIDENLTYSTVKTIICNTGEIVCQKKLINQYTIVDACNAVEWVFNNPDSLPEREEPSVGFVTGLVQDAQSLEPIQEVAVFITNEETGISALASVIDDEDGVYGVYYSWLEPGTYQMQFAADGYITETIYGVEITEGVVNYNVLLNLVPEDNASGTISGRVIDAFDASSIAQAELTVYAGINAHTGMPIATATSDSSGQYTMVLDPGNYTVVASADGYVTGYSTILVIADEYRSNQDCTLTPVLQEGEMRIVLTWGEFPSDLDSHLVGPTTDGGRFHIWFGNMDYYYSGVQYDALDVDDVTSYGPETTSVYVGVEGTYTFYIHNFSDRMSSNSSTMATSGAQVKLYIAGQEEPIVYNVPNQPGTLWTVFSVTDGVVTPINEMSYESDSYGIGE